MGLTIFCVFLISCLGLGVGSLILIVAKQVDFHCHVWDNLDDWDARYEICVKCKKMRFLG